MAMYRNNTRYEFNLTVKKYGDKEVKRDPYDYTGARLEENSEEELKEELTFNALSSVEVIRKLLDYIVSL